MIYAIQAGEGGPITFGAGHKRFLRLLKGKNYLTLLAVICLAGDKVDMIYRHLKPYRVHGRWYAPCEPTLLIVEAMRKEAKADQARCAIEIKDSEAVCDHISKVDASTLEWFQRRLHTGHLANSTQ